LPAALRPRRAVHQILRRGPGQRRHRSREDPAPKSSRETPTPKGSSSPPGPWSPTEC
jgi:hypothetical protein